MKEYRIIEVDLVPFLGKEGYLIFSPDMSELVLLPLKFAEVESIPEKYADYSCICYLNGTESEEEILKRIKYCYE